MNKLVGLYEGDLSVGAVLFTKVTALWVRNQLKTANQMIYLLVGRLSAENEQ